MAASELGRIDVAEWFISDEIGAKVDLEDYIGRHPFTKL
jgi:hypothetical protein